jgi:RHS repeat-associated protein
MGNPPNPEILASPIVTYRSSSVVPKVRWAPPYLVYQEYGQDIQMLGFVNLQELIIGYNSTPQMQLAFVDAGYRNSTNSGVDLAGNGQYVDAGDTLPIPDRAPAEFYGKKFNYVLQRTTQKILDFAVTDGGRSVGITLRNGFELNANNVSTGVPLEPSYRTLAFGGQPLNLGIPKDCYLPFGPNAYPRWVTIFNNLAMISNGVPFIRSVALVSLTPDNDGSQQLAVVDISLPETPKLLNKIVIPESMLGGELQSVTMRDDGLLEVFGRENLVLLDPTQLLSSAPNGQSHPAIISVVKGAGGITRSLGSTDYGVHAVADGGRASIVLSPPQLQFVSFPQGSNLVDPRVLIQQSESAIYDVLSGRRFAQAIPPARYQPALDIRSDLQPPNPALHFHVLVTAPGGAGESIEIGLEALNEAGQPLSNPGLGFAPVRAESVTTQEGISQKPRPSCGAPIRALKAYRLSKDPASPLFNRYLTQPFALVIEPMTEAALTQLKAQADREVLFSGAGLRAFLEPSQANNAVVGQFAAKLDSDRKLIYPVGTAQAFSVFRAYLPGDNPPPPGGITEAPGTYGSVCAHSGEFRTEAADMVLPSPRMPVSIVRTIGNQDSYEGPFGVGWDFNYNQRLTVLDPLSFPEGLQMPLVVRGDRASSEIAGSQDVLLHTGMGRTLLFKWVDNKMPPEYAQDPLVIQFEYANRVSDYYLPEKRQGTFDLFVKFKDGRFERLTPDGIRYRYGPQGRLESIIDRFPANQHVLDYDSGGLLVRIDDRSVSAPRYVEFGYYRNENTDINFNAGLDINTANPFLKGKICRLRDYAGGDVLFEYTADGFLERRLGKQVAGENGGFSGRAQTWYRYKNCRLVGVAVTANATPIFAADTATSSSGKAVAQSGTGLGNDVQLNIPVENSAASLNNLVSSVGLADGSATQFTFDSLGHPKSSTVTGPASAPATTTTGYDQEYGLLISVRHPEGNSETMRYDTNNPVFRSRGNLLSRTVDTGPRGGEGYTLTYQYELTYNLMSGDQRTPNGNDWTYNLRPDKRELLSIVYSSDGTETLEFDDHGQPLSRKDIRGVETTFAYDATTGFAKTQRLGDNPYGYQYGSDYASKFGLPSSINLPEGAAIQFEYNANLQRTRIKRGALIEDFGYDEQGRVQYHRQQMGDGKNLITRSGYDAKGFLTDLKFEGIEIDGVPGSLEYMMTPDTISRVKSVRHPRGTLQTFDYDARGNVTKTTLGDYSEKQDFDLNNNLTAVYQGGDLVKLFSHDGQDRPVTITRKTGTGDEIETRTYYPGGELKSKATLDTAFGEVAKQTDGQIDSLGRPRQRAFEGTTIAPVFSYTYAPGTMTETGPRMTTTRTWNKAGYTIGMTQPTLTVNYAPDGSGRIKQIDRHEDGANYSAYFTCDENDNRTSSADNLGPLLAFAPRAEGSLRAVTNANGHATTFDYSALGELTKKRRQDGMEFRYRQNRERQTSYKGDPSGGVGFDYDGDFRLTKSTLRNGIATTYGGFDARNMPQTIAIPGGSISALYDLQRRNAGRTVNFLSTTYSLQQVFDALNRVRIATYQQSGSGQNSATYTYDKAGPLLSARFQEDGADFRVDYTYYDDGSRKTVRYPSGAVVSEERDASGRLIGVSDSRGNIIKATAWKGNRQPSVVNLGATVQVVNQYDARGRLTASRVTGTNNSAVLSHLRYEYDAANNCKVRQFFHRGGRADSFAFDAGERVSQALLGAVPFAPAGSSQPLVSRVYNYDSGGLDYLTSVSTTTLGLSPPRFASTWSGHDAFLQPNFVDGFNRGTPDPMGNVALAQLQVRAVTGTQESTPIAAKLTHNGNGNLVGITRSDDFVEENFFQPGKLRYRRQISQSGSVIENRHYVYDDTDRLLEEYNRSGSTNQLVGRYYYASSDAPDAADLLNPSSGLLDRFYFLKDSMGSVVAMTDASGLVVERMWYDTFGQPVIEARDTRAPELKSIAAGTNGSLLLALSESVFFPTSDPGEGTGIIRFPEPTADGVVTVSINSTNITGTTELLPSYPGYAPYSVVRFTPGSPLPEVPSSLISWWPGDASVLDTVGGFAGALRGGATTGPGLVNEAFALNGTTAFVEVTNVAALNVGTTDFTLALWVNFTTTTGEQVLAEKWIQSTRSGWSLLKLADNRLRLAVGSGAGAETDIDSGVLPIKSGEWIHVAARRQGNTFALFTNGVVAASGNATFNLDAATSLKFGSRDGAGLFLKGSIDEITLHGRALTDGELTAVSGGVSVPGPVTVTLESGFLVDEWGNSNETATVAFQWYDNPGVVFYTAEPAPDTAPIRLARSSVGSPFLFHGQYFDYDTGLIYLRARFYDPFSGMFLEPDPLDYADSVNLYAGMRNNPVGYRDPTGLAAYDEMMRAALGLGKSAEAEKVLSQVSKSTRSVGEIGQEARSLTGTLGRGLEQVVSPVTRGAAQVTSGGRRLVILGLADNVRATAGRLEKAAKRISQDLRPKVDHFMDNARDWYVKVREAAAEVVAPGGKTTIRVNVTGFEGATLEEKVKAAILRGLKARMDEDYIKLLDEGHRFNGRQMEEFKQKIANDFSRRPSLNYDLTEATAVIGPNKQPFGATDLEIYMLYESGALFSQNVQFVEGVAGKVKLGNPFVGLPH